MLSILALVLAADLDAATLVARATETASRQAPLVVCQVDLATEVFGKDGKATGSERRLFRSTLQAGQQHDDPPSRWWKNGEELSAAQLKRAIDDEKKAAVIDFSFESPFSKGQVAEHEFVLLRTEQLWEHTVYVVGVKAKTDKGLNGTAWLDAETFVELKGTYRPATLPPHADWLTIQEQFTVTSEGDTVPSIFHLSGAGHFLFFSGGNHVTMKWADCQRSH